METTALTPRTKSVNFHLHSRPLICYKQSPESRCVAAGVFCCISRHRPASNVKSTEKFSIVPATGLHSECSWLSQQVFRRVPSKQGTSKVSSFLNFLSSVSGCAKCTPKLAFYPGRKAILLRARRAPDQNFSPKALSFRTALS